MVRHMISLNQSIRAQDVTIFDDIDATSFGFQEFLNVLIDNITKISSRYTTKLWVFIILLQRLHQLKIGLID